MSVAPFPSVAVDIGNSRIKCGFFSKPPVVGNSALPQPERTLTIDPTADGWIDLGAVCGEFGVGRVAWRIASVQRNTTAQLVERLRDLGVENIALLTSRDLPLQIALPQPDRVGIDRLLGAVAANHLARKAKRR
ncbi:MAG: type III pantothenate kinase [Pirellulales bacterium]